MTVTITQSGKPEFCKNIKNKSIGQSFHFVQCCPFIDGSVKQGPILKAGDFFGEKALMKDEKRAATVTAQEPGVECLTLDRVHFIEYLGGLQEVQDVAFDRKIQVEETKVSGSR